MLNSDGNQKLLADVTLGSFPNTMSFGIPHIAPNAGSEHSIKDDVFDRAFQTPLGAARKTGQTRKYRPRPPAVATSEAFKAYLKDMEAEKYNQEQEKLQKKIVREEKKSAAKQKLQIKSENRKKKQESAKKRGVGATGKQKKKLV